MSNGRPRMRWMTLGEVVAVAAVAISGVGLYMNYSDRRDARADKAAASAPAPLALRGSPNGDGSTLTLTAADPDEVVQGQTVRFPPVFGLAPASTTGDPRIEAAWFADAIRADRKQRHLPDAPAGDRRLPVLIETSFLADGEPHTARAFYDVGYVLEGRFLRGTAVKLRGLSLIGRAPADQAAADRRLAALWAARAG